MKIFAKLYASYLHSHSTICSYTEFIFPHLFHYRFSFLNLCFYQSHEPFFVKDVPVCIKVQSCKKRLSPTLTGCAQMHTIKTDTIVTTRQGVAVFQHATLVYLYYFGWRGGKACNFFVHSRPTMHSGKIIYSNPLSENYNRCFTKTFKIYLIIPIHKENRFVY